MNSNAEPNLPAPGQVPGELDTQPAFAHLETELAGLQDNVDLIIETGVNSFGFVVTDDQTHNWATEQLGELLAKTEPDMIADADPEHMLRAVKSVNDKGRDGSRDSGSTVLDLALMDYDSPEGVEDVHAILSELNMGRSLLINSGLVTVLVVPASKFDLYQQLPDLFSTRSFVSRLTENIE